MVDEEDFDSLRILQVSIVVDEEDFDTNQRLEPLPNVYSLGDCCANLETPLPALAQAWGIS
jgi:hypothetical protein